VLASRTSQATSILRRGPARGCRDLTIASSPICAPPINGEHSSRQLVADVSFGERLSEYRFCLVGLNYDTSGMARDFVACDRGQLLLMPPSLVEWLPEDHLVWTVLGAVEAMDLGRFSERYRLGAAGRAPYDPAMMVALLMYGGAGINRHGDGDGRALHRRASDPRWPRVMRWRSRGRRRSVDRGTCGLGY